MARLTLTFKGKPLQVLPIGAGETGIGRDVGNAMRIDSLAIAPHHAVVHSSHEGLFIRQLDEGYPVFVNNRKISEQRLNHGDRIAIGKHMLHYADDPHMGKNQPDFSSPEPEDPTEVTEATPGQPGPVPEASFQVLKGKHIGLVIPLRSALTRLGKEDAGAAAVVVRRKEGYFLSALAAAEAVHINDAPVNDQSIRLSDGDIVKVNQHIMRFFCQPAE